MEEGIIQRALGEKIVSLAGMFPVVSLTGPRRSGKTTPARAKFPDYAYVTLENLDDRLAAEFESFIIAEHIKSRWHAGRRPNVYFW